MRVPPSAPEGSRRPAAPLLDALVLCVLWFLSAGAVDPLAGAGPDDSGSVNAGNATAAIDLDGRLDEAVWKDAGIITNLAQQSPRPGEPTSYRTEVRILIYRDTLYFGFLCTDHDPTRIAVHTMQRDGNVEGDDSVGVVLDTYGDKRTGYSFQINAAGARVDGLISDPEHPSFDWDGIWNARTARTTDGWSAEIEIPVRSLSFTPGLKQWGLNL